MGEQAVPQWQRDPWLEIEHDDPVLDEVIRREEAKEVSDDCAEAD